MKLTFIIRKEIMKPLNNNNYQDTSNCYLHPDYYFSLSRSQSASTVYLVYNGLILYKP